MQFKISAASVLAFVASTIAQTAGFDSVFSPASWETIPAGKTFKVEWQAPAAYKGKSVSISLIGGATQGTQVPLLDIVSGISNDAGEYDWAVPADLGTAKVYGLVIKLTDDASVFQYSNPFQIDGPATVVKTTSASGPDYGTKTISLSSQAVTTQAAVTTHAGDYTTIVPVTDVVTVPCNNTVTPPPYTAPAQPTHPVVPVSYSNSTWTTAVVPPATTKGSSGGNPGSPSSTPIPGAGVRVGAGSMALFGGLLIAALAL